MQGVYQMLTLYLTPASVSFLTQFSLALAITAFLVLRLRSARTIPLALLTAFFALVTIFIGLLFLDAAFAPHHRLLTVYAQNTVLALALVALIQFAYRFPEQYPQHKWEARAALVISLAYFLWEARFMISRYTALFGRGEVFYRPEFASYSMAFVLLLAPIAFLRQCVAADPRPVSWLRKLWNPEGKGAQGARAFVLVFGILFVLGLFNVSLIFALPHTIYNAVMSVGILVALWSFATNYINFIPGGVNVAARLSILTLTLFLALLGTVGWLVAQPYITLFGPNLQDHQTLRFTPNAAGGYNVAEVDFHFEPALGEVTTLTSQDRDRNHRVEFAFPFYGTTYSAIYISARGAIGVGEPFWLPNLQAATATAPAIFPLVIELDPGPFRGSGGGVYVRKEADRLIITWNRLPAVYQSDTLYTFQAILYANGVFEFTYNGLPQPIPFNPDATPSANPWMRGAVSGRGEPLHDITNTAHIVSVAQSGISPLLENYNLAFRRYLHKFMVPVGWMVIGGSLLLLLAIPLLMRSAIVKPLEALTAGVRRAEAGDLTTSLVPHNEDEIGFLTSAFNAMTSELHGLVTGLEDRVAARTEELAAAKVRLETQLSDIQSLQNELREQAIRDPLTNAFNRRYLLETMERELARVARAGQPFSLIMLDVDRFKEFNDRHGHAAGDVILKRLVCMLTETTRKEDVVCRYGGDEFIVLMPNTPQDVACQRAEYWRQVCGKMTADIEATPTGITLSLGVVTTLDPTASIDRLLLMVDQAMYEAKAAGGNRTVVFGQSSSGSVFGQSATQAVGLTDES